MKCCVYKLWSVSALFWSVTRWYKAEKKKCSVLLEGTRVRVNTTPLRVVRNVPQLTSSLELYFCEYNPTLMAAKLLAIIIALTCSQVSLATVMKASSNLQSKGLRKRNAAAM